MHVDHVQMSMFSTDVCFEQTALAEGYCKGGGEGEEVEKSLKFKGHLETEWRKRTFKKYKQILKLTNNRSKPN